MRMMPWCVALLATIVGSGFAALAEGDGAEQGPRVSLPSDAVVLGHPPPRGGLALVLSGGGARGAAHIGVLKVLEEQKIVPDFIVGTSMGSIVGGLYAAGYSPQEIEDILAGLDWNEIFFDTVARQERTYRRKQDDVPYMIPAKLRFKGLRPYLPPGVLGGQKLELVLRKLVSRATDATDFNDLPIPYRAVAMDLATSEAVVLGEGDLTDSMRASMAIPGAFRPIVIQGRTLVDGGSAANLPVRIAQQLGAQRVIAVNISSPLQTEVEGRSFIGVVSQLSSFLTAGSVSADLERLRAGDILIQPNLGDISFKSFDRAREAVGIGEAAARAKIDELRGLGVDEARWREFQERHHRNDVTRRPVETVTLDNTSWVDDRIVQAQLHVPLGEPLDDDALEQQLVALSGLDWFGLIRYDLHAADGGSKLALTTPKKPHGRGSLQFGLSLYGDLEGDSGFALLVRHRLMAVNRRGGEWVNTLQVGNTSLLTSEFYQPLDWTMHWFVDPAVTASRATQSVWLDGQPVADYRIDFSDVRADVGAVLGRWGELRAGVHRGYAKGDARIAIAAFPSFKEDLGGLHAGFAVDTWDRVSFPTSGALVRLSAIRELEDFGAQENWTRVSAHVAPALHVGRSVFVPRAFAASNLSREATIRSAVALGGFLNLSGLGENELLGDKGGLISLIYYYELLGLGLGPIGNRVFAGASLEGGNVYRHDDPVTWQSLRYGGSLFLGADTPLGPAYFSWGYTEPDRKRFYVVIGQSF